MSPRTPSIESVPLHVQDVLQSLRHAGLRAALVGGCVRDLVGGTALRGDWDVAVDASPEAVMRVFPDAVPTGLQHGTVTVALEEGPIEVTSFRGEGAYQDGRRPSEVRFGVSLEEDLARRDFTINAMAWSPFDAPEVVVDPFGGAADLAAGVLRAVGEPLARFREDGLRALRAVRFAAVLGLRIEQRTAEALGHPDARGTLARVAWERRRAELQRLLGAPVPSVGLAWLARTQLLEEVVPELRPSEGCMQNQWHAFDVWTHTLAVVDAAAAADANVAVRWAALLHDVGKPESSRMGDQGEPTFYGHERISARLTGAILDRFRMDHALRDRVVRLVEHHLLAYQSGWTDAAVRRRVAKVGREYLEDLLALARADVCGKGRPVERELELLDELQRRMDEVQKQGTALSVRELAIGGREVMAALGIGAGPEVGEALRWLLDAVLESPERNDPETLRRMLATWSPGSNTPGS